MAASSWEGTWVETDLWGENPPLNVPDWNETWPSEDALGRVESGFPRLDGDDSNGPIPGVNNPIPSGDGTSTNE